MKSVFLALLLFIPWTTHTLAQPRDLTRWVNPFVGTGGHGHTFPGATLPFGMVQLSPDTRVDNWDGSSGYHYSDDLIFGFSHTHLSGTGIPDGCDLLVMPRIGDPAERIDVLGDPASSKFSHASEKAEPGYYSVKLEDGILAELTATERVGFHRYTFPKGSKANLVINLKWRDRVIDSKLDTRDHYRIEGYRRSSSWAKDETVYFAGEFSKKLSGSITETTPGLTQIPKSNAFTGKDIRTAFQFDNSDGQPLMLKLAISYVSVEGARANLAAELPGWNFDKVRADAKAKWNKELSKIEVSGGTDAQTANFYTALYHTMIQPNVFNDVDGKYRGHDGQTHSLRSGDGETRRPGDRVATGSPRREDNQFTVFSLWDTFRAAHPLYTIIDQKRTADFINTFIRIYEQGGRLPVWELWGEETDTMIGYHAVPVIADAIAKGIKGFDYDKAYEAAKHSADLNHFGLESYKRRGYVSSEDDNESVSKTLEYAYDDWCIMSMGATLFNRRSLGTPGRSLSAANDPYLKNLADDIDKYKARAGNFENVFDSETRFMRPRRNAGFIKPFAPQEVTFHFTEGNSWQYSFFVPHNTNRLIALMGGTSSFVAKLDELFTTETKLSGREQPDITGLIGQYAHGNEPSHHIAYLYNHAGVPSKTQRRVRQILDDFYKPTPDGLIGNEDCGQMSAWYVLSAAGFYPVVPGERRYDIGTPLFREVKFNLENGKKFIIRAPKVSATNIYINSAKWNGVRYPASYITQDQISSGGVLEFEMTDRPNDRAFTSFSTSSVEQNRMATPIVDGPRVFERSARVTIRTDARNASVYYTVDGSTPTRSSKIYSGPINVDSTTTVKAFAEQPGNFASPVTEGTFFKRANDWRVLSTSGYSTQYPGGGDDGIVDGLRGTPNFASGEWQGYHAKTFEAVIDLQRETSIKSVGGSFLQVASSWIWMPDRVEFFGSSDGSNFTPIGEIVPRYPQQDMTPAMKEFHTNIKPVTVRYVRVRATNIGKIPSWHIGAGGDPWIFVDEIFVQ